MRKTILLIVCVAAVTVAAADEAAADKPSAYRPPAIDAEFAELLRYINAVGPYEHPQLEVRKDANYAGTPGDVEPFGGVKPFKEHFVEQLEYTGPGRAIPEPRDVKSVKLGFIGPIEATVSVATGGKSHGQALGIQMMQGSQLAIEEANARGGYRGTGLPFELIVSNDNGLWGASGNEIIKQAYEDEVWAILGTIDGANSHIAIRVALKAEILMINSGDTDPTFIETNIPWVVRVIGDDRQQGYLLVDYLYRKTGFERVGIIRSSNRYGRFGVREIRDSSRRLGRPIVIEMAYPVGDDDFTLQLDRLAASNLDAVVHWGDAREGALILNQMRARGMHQPFFASDRSVSDKFVELAGDNAEGVICPFPWNPDRKDDALELFRSNFRERFGVEPDTFGAHAYDGMNMLIWATQTAGLNRAKIRDVMAYLPGAWRGVTGDISLSATLDDVGEVFLSRFEGGKWKYYSREQLKIPGGDSPPPARSEFREAAEESAPIAIAWFGPSDPVHPLGGAPWLAATLAIEQANAEGGFEGRPFKLLPVGSEDPWGSGITALARSVYDDGVVAIVAAGDGASAHLAETVVAKARVTLLAPLSTDKTVNMANVPWAFSCLPADDLLAEALGRQLLKAADGKPFGLISTTDHDSHAAVAELEKFLAGHGASPLHHLELEPEPSQEDISSTVSSIVAEVRAVAVLAGPVASARLLRAVREVAPEIPVLGGPSMARREFLEQAGKSAEGVVFPSLCRAASFRERFDRTADCATVQTYDAVRLLVEAVGRAGPDRERIRAEVEAAAPWSGEAGEIRWDSHGLNRRAVTLATYRDGEVAPFVP